MRDNGGVYPVPLHNSPSSTGWRRWLAAGIITVTAGVVGLFFQLPAYADNVRSQQWQLDFLRADEAWPYSRGDGVTVAVIDSGVDSNHPDLQGQVLRGTDFVDGTTDGRTDVVGHGTTAAGLIAGRDDDNSGVEGLAPKAKILPIRVLDANNQYESADTVAQAVHWAVDHYASVINLSLGSADTSPILTEALHYAFNHDVVVVACNGNYSNDRGTEVWHPAREPGVLAVSGVRDNGEFWEGSLSGPQTVLAAPAADITGAEPGGSYAQVQGTSFAAPLVSASAALVRSAYPQLSAPDVINRLISTAWDFGPAGFDNQLGYGIVNPTRAITADVPHVEDNPLLPSSNKGGSHAAGSGPTGPRIVDQNQESDKRSVKRLNPLTSGTALSLIGVAAVATTTCALLVFVLIQRRRSKPAVASGTPLSTPHSLPPSPAPQSGTPPGM